MKRSLYNNTLVRQAMVSSIHVNGAVNGVAVDAGIFANDFRALMFIVSTHTITDGTHAFTVQESADGSTAWTNVPAERIQGTLPSVLAANDDTVYQFGATVEDKQFFRVVATTSGATTGGVYSAVAVMDSGSTSPVARA